MNNFEKDFIIFTPKEIKKQKLTKEKNHYIIKKYRKNCIKIALKKYKKTVK